MSDATKILTVSYGTFSCTLEGFEDPFEAMQAVSAYFRDLAAQDRFFGAEPPTPDAEALQKLATQNVSFPVETQLVEDGVIIRPESADAEASEGKQRQADASKPTKKSARHTPNSEIAADGKALSDPSKDGTDRAEFEQKNTEKPAAPTPKPAVEQANDATKSDLPQQKRDKGDALRDESPDESGSTDKRSPAPKELSEVDEVLEAAAPSDKDSSGKDAAAKLIQLKQSTKITEDDAPKGNEAKAGSLSEPLPKSVSSQSEETNRLFSIAESQLTEEQAAHNRANFEHMKAAVAAQRAEHMSGEQQHERLPIQFSRRARYREDLAKVIRPRRVHVDVSGRAEQAAPHQAPLVLVSEQRVDSAAEPASSALANRTIHLKEHTPARVPQAAPAAKQAASASQKTVDKIETQSEANTSSKPNQAVDAKPQPNPVSDAERVAELETLLAEELQQNHSDNNNTTEEAQIISEVLSPEAAPEPSVKPASAPEVKKNHFDLFAERLDSSDATEIEDVIQLGAEYLTHDMGLPEFQRMHLLRLVRVSTDGSIPRQEAIKAVHSVADSGGIIHLGGSHYKLGRRPG